MTYLESSCFVHSKRDAELFAKLISYLPNEKKDTPSGCGPHSLRAMRELFRMAQPKRMLEVGFCRGVSATIWLDMGVEHLTSIDISRREETLDGARIVADRHDNFDYFHRDTFEKEMMGEEFDTIFIDAGHLHKDIVTDIALGRKVRAKNFLFDDWFECWGPGTQTAIAESLLVPLAVCGNMALCVERGYFDE